MEAEKVAVRSAMDSHREFQMALEGKQAFVSINCSLRLINKTNLCAMNHQRLLPQASILGLRFTGVGSMARRQSLHCGEATQSCRERSSRRASQSGGHTEDLDVN